MKYFVVAGSVAQARDFIQKAIIELKMVPRDFKIVESIQDLMDPDLIEAEVIYTGTFRYRTYDNLHPIISALQQARLKEYSAHEFITLKKDPNGPYKNKIGA